LIEVLPQITPLDQSERVLNANYVKRNLSTPLSPKHFRNQLKIDPGNYRLFRNLAEETWHGIQIMELEGARRDYGGDLRLMVRDRGLRGRSSTDGARVADVAPDNVVPLSKLSHCDSGAGRARCLHASRPTAPIS
jgi:hypothetical protein